MKTKSFVSAICIAIALIGLTDCVKQAPQACFTSSRTETTVTFSNCSTNSDSYVWNFGDGNSSTSTSPTNTYSVGGTYQVTLTAKSGSRQNQITQAISITCSGYGTLTCTNGSQGTFQKILIDGIYYATLSPGDSKDISIVANISHTLEFQSTTSSGGCTLSTVNLKECQTQSLSCHY
jgi:PKD repeat protein